VTKQLDVKSLINVGTLTSYQSWWTSFADTEFKESNGSAIKDEETLGKMVRDKQKAPAALYVHYLSNGLKCMVGATRWKRLVLSGKEKPMDMATASDEALTLLMYENYWPSWKDKHENKIIVRPPRYTKQEGMHYGE
jgi:hypothetical protein